MEEQSRKLGAKPNPDANCHGRVSKKRKRQQFDQSDFLMCQEEQASETQQQQVQPIQQNQIPQIEEGTPVDRFFLSLESNLSQFMNDRAAAYDFISNQLKQFQQDSSSDLETQMQQKLEYHQWATAMLKKGVQIQNRKLQENNLKAKNFDQLQSSYQVQSLQN